MSLGLVSHQPSTHVDPNMMLLGGYQPVEKGNYVWAGGLTEQQLHEAFIVGTGNEAYAFLKDERNCWKCRGWGHTKESCPSAPRPRPLAGCILGLQSIQTSQNERLRTMQNRRTLKGPAGPQAIHRSHLRLLLTRGSLLSRNSLNTRMGGYIRWMGSKSFL